MVDGRKRRKKNVYNVPPEKQCGKQLGPRRFCKAPRVGDAEGCRAHPNWQTEAQNKTPVEVVTSPPPSRLPANFKPTQTLQDVIDIAGYSVNEQMLNQLDSKDANARAALLRELTKAIIAQKKLDPVEIAKRKFCAETARQLASKMSDEQLRQILINRNMQALDILIDDVDLTPGKKLQIKAIASEIDNTIEAALDYDDKEEEDYAD